MEVTVFWFRRDLRTTDNTALFNSLKLRSNVLPIFIFDKNITSELEENDARISFIYQKLSKIHDEFKTHNSAIKVFNCSPIEAFNELIKNYTIKDVFVNEDYEPYANLRDLEISKFLETQNIKLHSFTDHVIFKPGTILKDDGLPYTVYTPFKKKWLKHFETNKSEILPKPNFDNLLNVSFTFPTLENIGFTPSSIKVEDYNLSEIDNYETTRDVPSLNATSYLGPHLRFGTVSSRTIIDCLSINHEVFLSELIWREFFINILYHYPKVVTDNFKSKYNGIIWRNNENEFQLWCEGKTGYPIVDAGMRQLNETGYMHNRVRMITASFLCKHLLIDWRWGEAYFAEKLLDYELASNNGNWQWVAGTGCDAAPYFRVFSPSAQTLRFDPDLKYIKKWVPELNDLNYRPIVDHKMARERALTTYKVGIEKSIN